MPEEWGTVTHIIFVAAEGGRELVVAHGSLRGARRGEAYVGNRFEATVKARRKVKGMTV
jgi:hypothetical protein